MDKQKNLISRRALVQSGAAIAAGLAVAGVGAASPAFADTPSAFSPQMARIRHFSLNQLVGQRVIFSYPGATPPQSLMDEITAGSVGGVIFFGENITSLEQIAAVITQLKQAHAQSGSPFPLLLTTDQEGGYIRRLRGQAPVLSEKAIGASADPLNQATLAGAGAGAALKNVGMNLNLAPVLDVFRVPGNFDDRWERSYSSDPKVCGELGAAFVTAQQQTGVGATVKHFPGLGEAARDANTDLGPVELDLSLSDLRTIDEAAFAPAIAARADVVMTSWATYPALDAQYPAGLSRTIVQGELRRRLRFRGVTMTDALEAGALEAFGDTGARSVAAAAAGMDLLLCSSRDVQQGLDAVAGMTSAVQSRKLSYGEFAVALERTLALRARLR